MSAPILCSWCDAPATRNLSTSTEQACEGHYAQHSSSDAAWAQLDATAPVVTNVKRHAGIAGQRSMSALVQYEGESAQTIVFVGSVYGPPIVMVTPAGHEVFVSSRVTDRIGSTLDAAWVQAFFAGSAGEL
jgi:hypothetical protein